MGCHGRTPHAALRLKEGPNRITYHAYFNGTDYDPEPGGLEDDLGFAAEIHVASLLTFFSEEGHLEPVQLHLEPLEEENSTSVTWTDQG